MKIEIINDPSFTVDLGGDLNDETQSIVCRTYRTGVSALKFSGILLISMGEAAYETIKLSGRSFKHIVLGWFGSWENFRPTCDPSLLVLKTAWWVLCMGISGSKTTLLKVYERLGYGVSGNILQGYASSEINVGHIRTNKKNLDVSNVPEEVTLDKLYHYLDSANFNDPNSLAYMSQTGGAKYDGASLKASLKTFMKNVKNRTPFLGTPPAYDTPRLFAFYQEIENRLRLSIDKVESNLQNFYGRYGTDTADYSDEVKQVYGGLLEDRSRLAIDIAIAGKACGGRYMGEAVDAHMRICGSGEQALGITLEDSLIEILSKYRLTLARKYIEEKSEGDTHAYSLYMGEMGRLLGLQGADNISEALSRNFNRDEALTAFFKDYTSSSIIAVINDAVMSSQEFREQISAWMVDQSGDWNQEFIDRKRSELVLRVEEIKSEQPELSYDENKIVQGFIQAYKVVADPADLPSFNNWEEFVSELLSRKEVKESFGIKNLMERMTFIQNMKREVCAKSAEAYIKSQLFHVENGNSNQFASVDSITKIKEVLGSAGYGLESVVIERFLQGEVSSAQFINNALDLERRSMFAAALQQESFAENGLPPKLMEWLLVSHKVFKPQTETKELDCHNVAIDKSKRESFIRTIETAVLESSANFKHYQDLIGGRVQSALLRSIRYKSSLNFVVEQGLRELITEVYKSNLEKLQKATDAFGIKKSRYSRVSNYFNFSLPLKTGKILRDPRTMVFAAALTIFGTYSLTYKAYEFSSYFIAARAVPFVINHAPVKLINMMSVSAATVEFVRNNVLRTLLISWIASSVISKLNIPILSQRARNFRVVRLAMFLLLPHRTIFFVLGRIGDSAVAAFHSYREFIKFCDGVAERRLDENRRYYVNNTVQAIINAHGLQLQHT